MAAASPSRSEVDRELLISLRSKGGSVPHRELFHVAMICTMNSPLNKHLAAFMPLQLMPSTIWNKHNSRITMSPQYSSARLVQGSDADSRAQVVYNQLASIEEARAFTASKTKVSTNPSAPVLVVTHEEDLNERAGILRTRPASSVKARRTNLVDVGRKKYLLRTRQLIYIGRLNAQHSLDFVLTVSLDPLLTISYGQDDFCIRMSASLHVSSSSLVLALPDEKIYSLCSFRVTQ
ncbi:hypothetical protein MRB53_039523 [Persea americana]|nr:hypothetical protein MRB53_039523 [Persea americana]